MVGSVQGCVGGTVRSPGERVLLTHAPIAEAAAAVPPRRGGPGRAAQTHTQGSNLEWVAPALAGDPVYIGPDAERARHDEPSLELDDVGRPYYGGSGAPFYGGGWFGGGGGMLSGLLLGSMLGGFGPFGWGGHDVHHHGDGDGADGGDTADGGFGIGGGDFGGGDFGDIGGGDW